MTSAGREWAPTATMLEGLAPALRVLAIKERLNILALLSRKERSAAELAGLLKVSRSAVSHHLRALQRVGLVSPKRSNGRGPYSYRCDGGRLAELTSLYLALLGQPPITDAVGRPGLGGLALQVLGPPPAACTYCQNSYYIYRTLEEMNRALAEARETQGRLRRLSSQVLSAQEEERKRVARDLHDDTAQALTSLLVRLRLLERQGGPAVGGALAELRQLAAGTLEGVRRLALNLRPSALDDLGLAAALRWYVTDFSQRWGLEVDLEEVGMEQRLPSDVELVLYRTVQEALTNVAKHANARRAKVRVERRAGQVQLLVEDDGRGFDVTATLSSRERGLGLFGIEERLALVGGKLTIHSQAAGGTTVEAQLSLQG